MGNANGREDGGSDSQSGADESGGTQVSMADQDGPLVSEDMGHSPPSSPRASQSPLMFRPQVTSLDFFSHILHQLIENVLFLDTLVKDFLLLFL